MTEPDAPKLPWVGDLPQRALDPTAAAALIVDALERQDEDEVMVYENRVGPSTLREETTRRRFRGQYLRRLRRLRERNQHLP